MKGKKKTAIIIGVTALAACVCGGSVFAYNVKEEKEAAKSLADIATVVETVQITETELAKFEQARADVEKKLEAEKKAEAEAAEKKAAEEAAAKAAAEEAAGKQAVASANRGSSNSGNNGKATKQYSGKKSSSSGKTSSSKKSTKTNNKSGGYYGDEPGYYPIKSKSKEVYIDGDSGNTCYGGEW